MLNFLKSYYPSNFDVLFSKLVGPLSPALASEIVIIFEQLKFGEKVCLIEISQSDPIYYESIICELLKMHNNRKLKLIKL